MVKSFQGTFKKFLALLRKKTYFQLKKKKERRKICMQRIQFAEPVGRS
jgi:hypothetical protein